jgi:hypothetical protein
MGDEELTAVGSRAGISHRNNTLFVAEGIAFEFIFKFVARSARTGSGRVAALNHKIADYPVESNPIVEALVGEEDKVVDRFGGVHGVEF